MKKGGKRIFNDKEALQEMLTLRNKGWSYTALSVRFNCDHSSILYQCRKHGVELPSKVPTITIKQTRHLKPRLSGGKILGLIKERLRKVWDNPVDEKGNPINRGHNYKFYIDKENEKNETK